MSTRLTTTSYVVLGLVEICEPATPYDLKQAAKASVFHLWSVPHTQIYSESRRLAAAGLLSEEQEEKGRRRRLYRLTAAGRKTLATWRAEPSVDPYELRDPGLVKLFFGADLATLAPARLGIHAEQLRVYEEIARSSEYLSEGQRLALEAGIGHEREFLRFWKRVADQKG